MSFFFVADEAGVLLSVHLPSLSEFSGKTRPSDLVRRQTVGHAGVVISHHFVDLEALPPLSLHQSDNTTPSTVEKNILNGSNRNIETINSNESQFSYHSDENADDLSSDISGQGVVNDSQGCTCMACLLIGVPRQYSSGTPCRLLGCNYICLESDYIDHERSHYHEPGATHYFCLEQHCKFTSKRWPDLIRHYTVKHCKTPKRFPCPVPWCKYSGANGFPRKDKLKSHQRNVHQERVTSQSSQQLRAIQPAEHGQDVTNVGSSSMTVDNEARTE